MFLSHPSEKLHSHQLTRAEFFASNQQQAAAQRAALDRGEVFYRESTVLRLESLAANRAASDAEHRRVVQSVLRYTCPGHESEVFPPEVRAEYLDLLPLEQGASA